MFLTQPALSRSIQALERDIGAPLVDRRTNGIELTDMGRLVLRHAISLDAAARDLDREIRLTKRPGARRAAHRVRAVGRGIARRPGRRCAQPAGADAAHGTGRRTLEGDAGRLRARQIDVMIGGSSDVTESADIESVTLSTHGTVVVGRHDHPLAGIDGVEPHALFDHPVIGPGLDWARPTSSPAWRRRPACRPAPNR